MGGEEGREEGGGGLRRRGSADREAPAGADSPAGSAGSPDGPGGDGARRASSSGASSSSPGEGLGTPRPRRWRLRASGLRLRGLQAGGSPRRPRRALLGSMLHTARVEVMVAGGRDDYSMEVPGACRVIKGLGDVVWDQELSMRIGRIPDEEDERAVSLTVYLRPHLLPRLSDSLFRGGQSPATIGRAELKLGRVPRLVGDEGTWFVGWLPLAGRNAAGVQLAVQLALTPDDSNAEGLDSLEYFLDEGWAQEKAPTVGPLSALFDLDHKGAGAEDAFNPPQLPLAEFPDYDPQASDRRHLGQLQIQVRQALNVKTATASQRWGLGTMMACVNFEGQWQVAQAVPQCRLPEFSRVFQFDIKEPTSKVTVVLVFCNNKEVVESLFGQHRLLGRACFQPSCLPGNKLVQFRLALASKNLWGHEFQKGEALVAARFLYASHYSIVKRYITPFTPADKEALRKVRSHRFPQRIDADLQHLLADRDGQIGIVPRPLSRIERSRKVLSRAQVAQREARIVYDHVMGLWRHVRAWDNPWLSSGCLVGHLFLSFNLRFIPPTAFVGVMAYVYTYHPDHDSGESVLFERFSDLRREDEAAGGEPGASQPATPGAGGGFKTPTKLSRRPSLNPEPDEADGGFATPLPARTPARTPGPTPGRTPGKTPGRVRFSSISVQKNPDGDAYDSKSIAEKYQMYVHLVEQTAAFLLAKTETIEKFLHLLHWSDPRLTWFFIAGCLWMVACLLFLPLSYLLAAWGLSMLRPPALRSGKEGPYEALLARLPTNRYTNMA